MHPARARATSRRAAPPRSPPAAAGAGGAARARPRAARRALAAIVPAEVTAGQVEAAIRAMKLPLLSRITLFDVYEGGQVGAGKRSLALSLTFQAPDRTLTGKEGNELPAKIVAEVGRPFAAEIRGGS